MAAQCVGNLEKVSGVVARLGARVQDAIVTGQLALDAQASRHPPHAGVRPVEGARGFSQRLREAITPPDVRQLVQQHRLASLGGPGVGNRRNQDDALADADGHRHRLARGFAAGARAG